MPPRPRPLLQTRPMVQRPSARAPLAYRPPMPPTVPTAAEYEAMPAELVVRDVHVRRDHITVGFYAMGLALRELARPERYRDELGFESFEDLLEQRKITSKMTAAKLVLVASTFPEAEARRLGMEKSYALIRYASVDREPRYAVQLAADNARIAGEPIDTISVRDLLEATKRKREALRDPRAPTEDETSTRRAARTLQAELRRSGLRSAEARAHRHAGVCCVRVDLSPTDAHALSEAL